MELLTLWDVSRNRPRGTLLLDLGTVKSWHEFKTPLRVKVTKICCSKRDPQKTSEHEFVVKGHIAADIMQARMVPLVSPHGQVEPLGTQAALIELLECFAKSCPINFRVHLTLCTYLGPSPDMTRALRGALELIPENDRKRILDMLGVTEVGRANAESA